MCGTFTGVALGSAVGKIASDFNDFENMSWVSGTHIFFDCI
jgi:hypothetical protein